MKKPSLLLLFIILSTSQLFNPHTILSRSPLRQHREHFRLYREPFRPDKDEQRMADLKIYWEEQRQSMYKSIQEKITINSVNSLKNIKNLIENNSLAKNLIGKSSLQNLETGIDILSSAVNQKSLHTDYLATNANLLAEILKILNNRHK